ncbi:MAG: DegT/DnrJ/EryC1/StrS family aminotransferase, partial [Nitrospinaceae bacterium]|nr:DegT/DnrJ/EryC1/StrS family aminotransferase [Nitrospinaceae bacterium]
KVELMQAVEGVIDRGDFILGESVAEFERRFAELCGVRYAVGVNSGTDALVIALRALDIGPGDEVITAPNSFVASASCIELTGAKPVFVDVRDDYNIDPALLEAAVTPKTRAILPVHLTGRPADMEPINEVARRHGLHVVEDAAQAVSAGYRGRNAGALGTIGCFSLHPLKTLNACGDGGMLTTDDETLFERFKLMRNLGLESRDNTVIWSGNSRLDSIQAAMLLVKMKYLDAWTEKRRSNATHYQKALAGVTDVSVPTDKEHERAVYHAFVIQAERRDELKAHLESRGVGSAVHYPRPIHLQSVGASLGYGPGSFPETERQADKILSLPIYPELTEDDLGHVAATIEDFYQK